MKRLLMVSIVAIATLTSIKPSATDPEQNIASQAAMFQGTANETFSCIAILVHGWQQFATNGGNVKELNTKISGWRTLRSVVIDAGAVNKTKHYYDWVENNLLYDNNFYQWFNYCYNCAPVLDFYQMPKQ